MNFMSHSTQNKVSPRGRKNDIPPIILTTSSGCTLTSTFNFLLMFYGNHRIKLHNRRARQRDIRICQSSATPSIGQLHSHMGHRRTGSVHLADQDNVAADSQIRPPVCSEYWSVHYLLMSWRPLYMEAICEDNHALGQCTLVIITMTDRWMDHSMLFVKKYDQFIFLFCQFNCISKISHYWWMVSCNSCKNYDNLAVVRCRIWQTDGQN